MRIGVDPIFRHARRQTGIKLPGIDLKPASCLAVEIFDPQFTVGLAGEFAE